MKVITEELNYIKYLFDYQRGKVISEQKTLPTLEKDGCEKGFYRDCKTKECIKKPKNTIVVYTQEDFDKKLNLYNYAKKYNSAFNSFVKRFKDFLKKTPPTVSWIEGGSGEGWERGEGGSFGLTDVLPSRMNLTKHNGYERRFLSPEEANQYTFWVDTDRVEKGYADSSPIYQLIRIGENDKGYTPNQLKKKGHSFTGKYYYMYGYGGYISWFNPQLKELYPILGCKEEPNIPTTKKEEQPVLTKVTDITKATSILQIPKDFVLSGSYYCNGKNSLGNMIGDNSVYNPQCQNLPNYDTTKKNYGGYMASWEIKFQPNVAGNPNTVPVTRWNIFWNEDNKIKEITSYNFNKVPTAYQKTIENLFGKPGDDKSLIRQRLKDMMYVNSGEDNNVWTKYIEPFLL